LTGDEADPAKMNYNLRLLPTAVGRYPEKCPHDDKPVRREYRLRRSISGRALAQQANICLGANVLSNEDTGHAN
jgi:hypothetical protein